MKCIAHHGTCEICYDEVPCIYTSCCGSKHGICYTCYKGILTGEMRGNRRYHVYKCPYCRKVSKNSVEDIPEAIQCVWRYHSSIQYMFENEQKKRACIEGLELEVFGAYIMNAMDRGLAISV